MPPILPPPRAPGRYRIEFVCSGNICRSPSADVVLVRMLADAGLTEVDVSSSGIGGWHVGDPMDHRSAAVLAAAGYDPSTHRARKWQRADLASRDLVLAMDRSHVADLPRSERVRLFRDFDPVDTGSDVPDPYYGGPHGFQEVLTMIERTCQEIIVALERVRPEWRQP